MQKELEDIVKAYLIASEQGMQTALATVVHVEGSSYRQPGARMLITENGALTGAISGGCLEGDALRKAQLAMLQQKPMLVTYDTTDEDDATIGVGLGCNGIIHILLEPLGPHRTLCPLTLLQQQVGNRDTTVLVTLFNLTRRSAPQPGTCVLITDGGERQVQLEEGPLRTAILTDVCAAFTARQSAVKTYDTGQDQITALIAWHPPAIQLLVAGAGNDVQPLVKMAAILGWHTTVVDGRPAYAQPQRFPEAARVIVAKPVEVLQHLQPDDYTAAVLMTHNYNYDIALLSALLPHRLPYIGVLGPARKLQRMLQEMEDTGAAITPEQRARIYGPVGLDIGADTPEEIALSVISEVKAVMAGAPGDSLRNNPVAIHQRAHQQIIQKQL
ncbi:XdhC family protein [Chitinophaga qingshengii]|uniref:XdhC family protein n=1 Tax=Chitinophaga qingshengii TaxID=1569794 RepID=A0ABR7TPF5_9BACT|nr:XdhC/CoxI family protein [Chitinophaga qingshengii]MBC9932363.1 XdhC family protein [Chitinophaga qingshengii]